MGEWAASLAIEAKKSTGLMKRIRKTTKYRDAEERWEKALRSDMKKGRSAKAPTSLVSHSHEGRQTVVPMTSADVLKEKTAVCASIAPDMMWKMRRTEWMATSKATSWPVMSCFPIMPKAYICMQCVGSHTSFFFHVRGKRTSKQSSVMGIYKHSMYS